ncbi:hypothetical protein K439DRAFT_1634956 [Ramaria rubella]|nr:hypothetical protein K439DRAFT_1634956 [Ramaria rubella]
MSFKAAKANLALRSPSKPIVSRAHRNSLVSEMASVEMGQSFVKAKPCDWESSYFQLNSDLSTDLPALPERAYVSGWVPYPPGVPRCQSVDAAKSPIIVAHSTENLNSLEVVLGDVPAQEITARASLRMPEFLIDFNEDAKLPQSTPRRFSRRQTGLGLHLQEFDGITTGSSIMTELANSPRVRASAMEDLLTPDSVVPCSAQLPTPSMTPLLPVLVPKTISVKSTSAITRGALITICDSPPPSPPMAPSLVLTSPSLSCSLGTSVMKHINPDAEELQRHLSRELQSWNDILGLQEYEYEDGHLDKASVALLEHFPTPPETPTLPPTVPVPQFTSTHRERVPCPTDNGDASAALEQQDDKSNHDNRDEKKDRETPFDYAAFRERLATFLKDIQEQNEFVPRSSLTMSSQEPIAVTVEIESSTTEKFFDKLDNGNLRTTRKRSATTLLPAAPTLNGIRGQEHHVRVTPRPLPLPIEIPAVLCRGIQLDRSKAKDLEV